MSEPVIVFKRVATQVLGEGIRHMEPKTWAPVERAKYMGKGSVPVKAIVCCPYGHEGTLTNEHQVSDAGVVSPSCICPHEGCPWHDYITLEDWREPWKLEGWTP